jgi:hypothetical protein
MAANKTTHSEKRDPQSAKPSKESWPIGGTRRRISNNFSLIE